MCVFECLCVCMCIYVCVRVCMCVGVHVRVCVRVWVGVHGDGGAVSWCLSVCLSTNAELSWKAVMEVSTGSAW